MSLGYRNQEKILKFFPIFKWNPFTKFSWIARSNTNNVYFVGTLVLSLIARRRNFIMHMYNSCVFQNFCCRFCQFAWFWSDFEQYNVLVLCLWNPKQQRSWKKICNVADNETNLFSAYRGIRLLLAKYTVWLNSLLSAIDSPGKIWLQKIVFDSMMVCHNFSRKLRNVWTRVAFQSAVFEEIF